jgi:sugar phosphate isomerase/epimerase
MEILLSTGSLSPRNLATAARIASAAGVDGLEVMANTALLAEGAERAKRAIAAHNLPIRSVHPPVRFIGAAQYAHDDLVATAEFARAIPECRTLVMHSVGGTGLHTEQGRAFLQTVAAVTDTLGKRGIRLTIENRGTVHPKPKLDFLDKLPNLYRVCEEWDLGITMDTSHAASFGLNIVAALDVVGSRLVNVHLSDRREAPPAIGSSWWNSLTREHQPPGMGALPLGAFLRRLKARHYQGAITLELSPLAVASWNARRATETIRAAIAFVREQISDVPAPPTDISQRPRRTATPAENES